MNFLEGPFLSCWMNIIVIIQIEKRQAGKALVLVLNNVITVLRSIKSHKKNNVFVWSL